jgi:ankyrin repeat protein
VGRHFWAREQKSHTTFVFDAFSFTMKSVDPLPALCVVLQHALPIQSIGVGSDEGIALLVAAGRLGTTCKTLREASKDHTEYVSMHQDLNQAVKTANLAGIEKAIAKGAHPDGFRATWPPSDKTRPVWLRNGACTPLHLVFRACGWLDFANSIVAAKVAVATYALVKAGANVNARAPDTLRTPVIDACERGMLSALPGLLLADGVDVNLADAEGKTPLVHVLDKACNPVRALVSNQAVEAIMSLLEAGADPNIPQTSDGTTPLHIVTYHINSCGISVATKLLKTLLAGGANPNAPDNKGLTPLHKLLYRGARLVSTDAEDAVPTELALFLRHGANLRAACSHGRMAMHYLALADPAYMKWVKAVSRALVARGVDVDVVDNSGRSPLAYVCYSVHMTSATAAELVDLFLDLGCDFNAKDTTGSTPFFYLKRSFSNATNDRYGIVRHCCMRGADINAVDLHGNTLLHLAVTRPGKPGLCKALLECGAAVNIRNAKGKTPLQLATASRGQERTAEQRECMRLLTEAGAKLSV